MPTEFERLRRRVMIANRILAQQGVLDAFGHVSFRHPDHPDRYVMSRSLAPQLVTEHDLLEYDLEGTELNGDTRRPYAERFIHGAIYEARPEVQAVCHNHSYSTIPFGVTDVPLRAIWHTAGLIGHDIPVWDIAPEFGATDLLVVNMAQGRSLAKTLGPRRVALMRGHGAVVAGESVQEVVIASVYMEHNARLLSMAHLMGNGKVHALDADEARLCADMMLRPLSRDRAWDFWRLQAGFDDED